MKDEQVYSYLDLRVRATSDYYFNPVLEITAVKGGELIIKVEGDRILIQGETVPLHSEYQ